MTGIEQNLIHSWYTCLNTRSFTCLLFVIRPGEVFLISSKPLRNVTQVVIFNEIAKGTKTGEKQISMLYRMSLEGFAHMFNVERRRSKASVISMILNIDAVRK